MNKQDWGYCPECGTKAEHIIGREVSCTQCGQSWFVHIDYTNEVRHNLSSRKVLEAQLSAALSEKSVLQDEVYNLQATICDMEDKESILIDNKRLREEKSAYREALEKIANHPELSFSPIPYWVQEIARAALDRGPEEPVGREELAYQIDLVSASRWKQEDIMNVVTAILKTFRVERR